MRRIETKRNETIIFIFSLVQRFPICFGLKCVHNCFFEFFFIFFGIFYYASSGNETERQFLFSLLLGLSNLFWLGMKPQWYFFYFFIFFLFFCNFLLPAGYERNGKTIFIFSLSRPFPSYFGLKWSHNGIFYFIEFFCYFFLIFSSASGRNETKR